MCEYAGMTNEQFLWSLPDYFELNENPFSISEVDNVHKKWVDPNGNSLLVALPDTTIFSYENVNIAKTGQSVQTPIVGSSGNNQNHPELFLNGALNLPPSFGGMSPSYLPPSGSDDDKEFFEAFGEFFTYDSSLREITGATVWKTKLFGSEKTLERSQDGLSLTLKGPVIYDGDQQFQLNFSFSAVEPYPVISDSSNDQPVLSAWVKESGQRYAIAVGRALNGLDPLYTGNGFANFDEARAFIRSLPSKFFFRGVLLTQLGYEFDETFFSCDWTSESITVRPSANDEGLFKLEVYDFTNDYDLQTFGLGGPYPETLPSQFYSSTQINPEFTPQSANEFIDNLATNESTATFTLPNGDTFRLNEYTNGPSLEDTRIAFYVREFGSSSLFESVQFIYESPETYRTYFVFRNDLNRDGESIPLGRSWDEFATEFPVPFRFKIPEKTEVLEMAFSLSQLKSFSPDKIETDPDGLIRSIALSISAPRTPTITPKFSLDQLKNTRPDMAEADEVGIIRSLAEYISGADRLRTLSPDEYETNPAKIIRELSSFL